MIKCIFKIASLLTVAVMLFSCHGQVEPENGGTSGGELELIVDKSFIQSNGVDAATFRVTFDGQDVTADAIIFDADDQIIELQGGKFTTTTNGAYQFWAAYKTLNTKKEMITVNAIPVPVPSSPADPDPSNTSFVRRVQLTQFTGNTCGWCPYMNQIIREVRQDPKYADKFIVAACHSYEAVDPAYLSTPLDDAMGVTGYPYVVMDMASRFNNYNSKEAFMLVLDDRIKEEVKAGISVNPVLKDGILVVKATVKAAKTGNYRIGAWLLEDDIYAMQTSALVKEDHYHNNCIRIADSMASSRNCAGYSLGTIEAGETADYVFVMNLKKSWVVENLHLNVFVSVSDDNGYYSVNNVIDCPITSQTQFEYSK